MAGRKVGVSDPAINVFTCEATFSTLTNVDFDPQRFVRLINQSVFLRDGLKAEVMAKGGKGDFPAGPATFKPEGSQDGLVKQAEAAAIKNYPAADADILALKHTLLFGIKGVAPTPTTPGSWGRKTTRSTPSSTKAWPPPPPIWGSTTCWGWCSSAAKST